MRKIFTLVIFIVLTPLAMQAQDFILIVNSSNPVSTISQKDASKIFMKKQLKWEDGTSIVPVDQSAKSAARISFSKEIHKKNVDAIQSYWQSAIFSGSGHPPIEKGNDEEVMDFVKNNSGAIGYVSAGTDLSGVKAINISD